MILCKLRSIAECCPRTTPSSGARNPGMSDKKIVTDSGIPIEPVYSQPDEPIELAPAGEFPYTRGIHPGMYRSRRWTMRQYAGFSSAEDSNKRYRLLMSRCLLYTSP